MRGLAEASCFLVSPNSFLFCKLSILLVGFLYSFLFIRSNVVVLLSFLNSGISALSHARKRPRIERKSQALARAEQHTARGVGECLC